MDGAQLCSDPAQSSFLHSEESDEGKGAGTVVSSPHLGSFVENSKDVLTSDSSRAGLNFHQRQLPQEPCFPFSEPFKLGLLEQGRGEWGWWGRKTLASQGQGESKNYGG